MSQPRSLPTADDFFGAPKPASDSSALPTADEFFASPDPSLLSKAGSIVGSAVGDVLDPLHLTRGGLAVGSAALADARSTYDAGDVHSSPAMDAFFAQNTAGRVLHAFGQGAQQGWGTEPLGISPENEALLRKAGIFNDYASGRTNILKSVNEAFLRPAATAIDLAMRAGVALPTAAGTALRQISTDNAGNPIIAAVAGASGEIVGAIPQGFLPEGGFHGMPEGAPAARTAPIVTGAIPLDLAKARSLAVIGEGEDAYLGLKQPTPENVADRATAVREAAAIQPSEVSIPAVLAPAGEAPVVPDIHTVARQIAPDTFSAYDALAVRQDTFRRWLTELAATRENDPRVVAANTEIETILGKVNGVEDRLTAKAADRLDAIREDVDRFRRTDTPDMARVRGALQGNDFKMRDLAPDVAKAYRTAQEQIGPQNDRLLESGESGAESSAPSTGAVEPSGVRGTDAEAAVPALRRTEGAEAPSGLQPPAGGDLAVSGVPSGGARSGEGTGAPAEGSSVRGVLSDGQGHANIVRDVQQKLEAAGRPTEEAQAVGQIVNAYYETRAARFEGKKGTAAELYARDAPAIKGNIRLRARELASKTLEQRRRGTITLGDARNTIRLFKDADASTFIHEIGHDWLEQLTRDATDPNAPADLIRDSKTVRDWLKVGEGDSIPTKAHEKFARGFERYMMEGVAPSKALASVFAKFRDWLTKIYQTVNRLRSPINDDIRAVFDRMLSTNPERTVIAPERETAPSLADTHERLAEETHPDKAHEIAEQIRSEIDAKAREVAPDVAEELHNAGPSEEAGREPSANTGAASGSNAPAPERRSVRESAEPGTVAEGGNATAPEGDQSTGGGRTGRTTPEPTAANEHFAEHETPLLDKAGNIRLDNLGTPDDVNQVIRDTAKGHNDFITARRGVLTDGEVLDLADAIGMDANTLNARKIGEAFSAEQIVAARKLLIKSASDVRDKMTMAATGSDADVMAYAEAKTRHNMIQEQVAGLTAEAGRALRAFRKLEGGDEAKAVGDFIKEATGRTLNQLRMEAKLGASLQTPAQVSRFARMTDWQKARGAILEYYVNCLISGPVTHFRYAVGNAINAIVAGGIDTPIAAGIGALKQGFGLVEKGDRVYLGEAGAQMLAITKGSRDGFRAGYDAFRTGVSPALPGERASEMWSAQRAIPGKLGTAINIPSKSVSAIHSFFKSLRYEQNMQAMAYRTAMKEGLDGSAFDNRVSDLTLTPSREMMDAWEDRESYDELETALAARDIARGEGLSGEALDSRVESLIANPTPEIKEALNAGTHTETARIIAENSVAATKESLRELYLSPTKYGTTSAWINKAINSNIVFKIMVPFMKIGLQITRNAFVERTVLGFADKDVRENLLGKNGGAAQDMQWARVTTGTAVIGITALMASEGLATGDGPEDPKQRAAWLLTHKPNTITIGDITVPYQGLGSLGMLMRFSANAVQTASMIGHESTGDVAIAALEGLSKSVLDENFLRGMKDALDAIYHPVEYGENYLKGFVTNWLPYSVGMSQIARQIDPTLRDTKGANFWEGLIDTIKAKTPFISESLMPRRDMFGVPINPDNLHTYANDPVVKEMAALQFGIGRIPRKIRGIDLTPEQYEAFSATAGRLTKMQMDAIVAIPGFDNLPAGTRLEMMRKAVEGSRETARSLIMMQSIGGPNDIVRAAISAKTSIVSGAH